MSLALVAVLLLPVQALAGELPRYVRVFRMHHHGSSIPARVERVPFQLYVGRVMASGAWPARKPWASLQLGAAVVKQYAWWMILHHQPGYSWRGQRFDITDSDQLYRDVKVPRRISGAVRSTWTAHLHKRGRLFRTGWRGGLGQDGWHVYEGTASRLARRGWSWQRIARSQLDPVEVRR